MRRPASPSDFFRGGSRLVAAELAKAGDANAWNAWRHEINIFGDYQKSRVNLALANLNAVDLRGYNLTNVSFYRAELSGANLDTVDCAYADFHETKLLGADMRNANLRFARLSRAYLRDAKLDHADLRGSDLRRASLRSASLIGTDVRGVDLSGTRGLDQDQLDDAMGDSRTRVPAHLIRPPTWEKFDRAEPRDDEGIEDLRAMPASVEVAVIAGVVRLSNSPGDAHFASTADPVSLRREILEDLAILSPRCGNIPALSRAIEQYTSELSKDQFDIIIVGVRGLKIQAIFESVAKDSGPNGPELLPDATGALRAVLIQHFLFVNQSHKWKAFLEEAALTPYTQSDRDVATRGGHEVAGILEAHPDACDVAVPRAIRQVTAEVDIDDDGQRLSVINALGSIENIYKGIVTWIVREAKRFLGDTWETFRNNLSKILGVGMATLVTSLMSAGIAEALATLYPDRFAWLTHAIDLIKLVAP